MWAKKLGNFLGFACSRVSARGSSLDFARFA
uniref:Uncharacterized protein n=1 Tax=Arundo donax TaxID=35708 RepID=A0A0A8Z696_ARUDO